MFDSRFKLFFGQFIDKLKLFEIELCFFNDFFEDVLFFFYILRIDFRFLSFDLDVVELILLFDSFDSILPQIVESLIKFFDLNFLKIHFGKIDCVLIIF